MFRWSRRRRARRRRSSCQPRLRVARRSLATRRVRLSSSPAIHRGVDHDSWPLVALLWSRSTGRSDDFIIRHRRRQGDLAPAGSRPWTVTTATGHGDPPTAGATNLGVVGGLAGMVPGPGAGGMVPRRRGVRRCGDVGAPGPAAVRRDRAGRQLRRRPAQVAVSRRSTARRSSTGTGAGPGPPTPSTPSTSTCLRRTRPRLEPSDYAYHLSRRARACRSGSRWPPTDRPRTPAVETGLRLADGSRGAVPAAPVVAVPWLSSVWICSAAWVGRDATTPGATARSTGLALVVPTSLAGRERVLRFCFIDPRAPPGRRPGDPDRCLTGSSSLGAMRALLVVVVAFVVMEPVTYAVHRSGHARPGRRSRRRRRRAAGSRPTCTR